MAEYAVIIDRSPGAQTVAAYAADPEIDVYVIRDAEVSDDDLIASFGEALRAYVGELHDSGLPLPTTLYKVVTVAA